MAEFIHQNSTRAKGPFVKVNCRTLTEIGDLPLPLQVKLLTFLDDKIIFPMGGTKGKPVDVRIVAATHPILFS